MEEIVKRILFLLSFLIFGINSYAQKLFISMDDLPSDTWSILKENGAIESKMIYGDYIYPNNSSLLVTKTFEKEINKLYPDPHASGVCILDWEGTVYENLINDKVSLSKKQSAQIEFLKAIKIAKKLRPNVKWGFFGLPQDNHTPISEKYLIPIYKEVDIISPAVYISSPSVSFDTEKMKRSAVLAKKYGKLLYPVFWDRFNTTNKSHRHKLLSETQFNKYLLGLKKFTYSNKSVDGLIYWGRDTYFYGGYKTAASEAKSMDDFKVKYKNRVLKNTKRFFNSK